MEQVSVNFKVLTHNEVFRFENIALTRLIAASLQKFASPEARVLAVGLIDLKAVVIEEVGNDELSVAVLGLRSSKDSVESQGDLLVDPFEEVFLRWFRDQPIDVSQRVLF